MTSSLHDFGALGPIDSQAHGSRPAYQAGCRCTPCRSANAGYIASRRRQIAHRHVADGQVVSSYRVRRCLRGFLSEGFTVQQLATRLGLHVRTLGRHIRRVPIDEQTGQLAEAPPRMRARSAARILALHRLLTAGDTDQ